MPINIPSAEAFTPVTQVKQVTTLAGTIWQSIGQIDATNTTAGPLNPVGNVTIVP